MAGKNKARNTPITKQLLSLTIGIFMISGLVLANPSAQNKDTQQKKTDNKPKKAYVDYDSDVARIIEGDSAKRLIDVVFHHNGVLIQCDSALMYDKMRMDCHGNVVIQQDSTFIYGDMATYDGNKDMVTVHAPLVKITNGKQTVMYTYNLTFNTRTKVGEFFDGGVVTQRDNVMEAERGKYYSSTNDVVLFENVSMRNNKYQLRTDSLKFNLDTEVTTFLAKTYIWDDERDFLSSQTGTYDNKASTYTFTQDAYILNPDQEVWADSIIYISSTKEAFLKRNIQILDTTQKTLAFGDWGYYNESLKKAILARNPSVRTWEISTDSTGIQKIDTAYLRADSIYFETYPRGTTKPQPSDSTDVPQSIASPSALQPFDSAALAKLPKSLKADSTANFNADSTAIEKPLPQLKDSLSSELPKEIIADSVQSTAVVDTIASNKPTRQFKAFDTKGKITPTVSTAITYTAKTIIPLNSKKGAASKTPIATKSAPLRFNRIDSLDTQAQGASFVDNDSVADRSRQANDSIVSEQDTISKLDKKLLQKSDSTTLQKPDSVKNDADSTERLIRAFRNVRSFRKDFQGACDSLVGYSVDSTASLFWNAVIWNEKNQITAEQIDIYTKNEQMDWADFIGDPFVSQEIEEEKYNQAKGRSMKAYFKNNELDKAHMKGNVRNIFWREDGDENFTIPVELLTMESAELEMYFQKREISRIKWVGQETWAVYPLDMIPADLSLDIEGFKEIKEKFKNTRPLSPQDVCKRIERPSIREEAENYEKPSFYIESKIKKYKEMILKSGTWRDRIDQPRLTVEFFINRLD